MMDLIRTTNFGAWEFLPIPTLHSKAPPLWGKRSHCTYTITGKKGSGKSTLVREIITKIKFARTIVFDYNEEYTDLPGVVATRGPQGLIDVIQSTTLDSYASPGKYLKVAYLPLPGGYLPDETLTVLDNLVCFTHTGGLLVVIEEAQLSQSPSELPQALKVLISTGRHKKITSIFVTQRPAGLNRHTTAQSEAVIAFRTTEPLDLDYLKKLGFDPEVLPQLGIGECLIKTL